ncbi:unnamed protein product [Oppiella nova]|uniref:G-protein coupled receptors family 1 profile domain-containing protein n=1 Tax=Oppiella nova TaxID=334625 RepID=A0A7R9QQ81_9ACAR|nr:unnamed protein product [Oppiella nova]CAG2171452.1 unnamed protein product [Oppiella nova]
MTLHSPYGTISRLTCFIDFDPYFRKSYYTFLFITFYLIPLVFIGWTCFCIARSLLRITALNRQGSLRRQEVNRRKIGQMILIVVMAYTISWTPYFIVSIITQYQEVNFMQKHNFYFTMLCINLFAFLNSSINPFIYAIMSTRFRNGFMRILRLILCFNETKTTQDIIADSLPKRRVPKPLACLNKYHRQMLLLACGEPSQLSTDSSTQHDNNNSSVGGAIENSFSATFLFNRIHFHRRVTLPAHMSMRETTHTNLNHNDEINGDYNLTANHSADTEMVSKLNANYNERCNPLKGVVGEELLDLRPDLIHGTVMSPTTPTPRQRTGSESILPSLKRFWEQNFMDFEDTDGEHKNRKLYASVCAISQPNSHIIVTKNTEI